MNLQRNTTTIKEALRELGQLEKTIMKNTQRDARRYYDSIKYFRAMSEITSCLTPREIQRLQLVQRSKELILDVYVGEDPSLVIIPRLGVLLAAFTFYDVLEGTSEEILELVVEALCQDIDKFGSVATFWDALHDACLWLHLEWLYLRLTLGQKTVPTFEHSQVSAASLLLSLSADKESIISLAKEALSQCLTLHAQRRYIESLTFYFVRMRGKCQPIELDISEMFCQFGPDEEIFLPWMPVLFYNSRRSLLDPKDAKFAVCTWASRILNKALTKIAEEESISGFPWYNTMQSHPGTCFRDLQKLNQREFLTYRWHRRDLVRESIRWIRSSSVYQWNRIQVMPSQTVWDAYRNRDAVSSEFTVARTTPDKSYAVVFDTNAIFDMVEEIISLAGEASCCFAIPQTVINELLGLRGDKARQHRVNRILTKLSDSNIFLLLLSGKLCDDLGTERALMESWSGLHPNVSCCDEAILYAVLRHGNATLVSNDVNMMLKGAAWGVQVLPWDEFIGTRPWAEPERGK